ncbi:MAG: hypothetical protein OJK14_04975 [Achromobacter sp.]|jgi:hypothetical protein|uniref:hypothetical protein n=1 Tax=Achromobacter sp. TaxID=134375 RepID=UPI002587648D|nr:hypothetical protein [Achromobacter sp.]MCW0206427.1 hypothetical protein [Achromobacter sp.]
MSIQSLGRFGAALCLAALVSGCSSIGLGKPERQTSSASKVSAECQLSRSKCLYEGAYESGERDYAEEEAKRLNLAEVERLRRGAGR